MLNDRNQPRRLEGWVARKDTQSALRELRAREDFISTHGILAYVQECVRSGRPLPYPFSDARRWADIAEDESTFKDWRAAARWLLENLEDGSGLDSSGF